MELRPELLPPPVSSERIDELSAQIERICDLLDRRLPDADQAASAIADFNAMTGHAYAASDFAGYYESRNVEDFTLEAARPAWPRVPDITRDEMVGEVITAHHRNVALLVAGCYFMEMLDGTNVTGS